MVATNKKSQPALWRKTEEIERITRKNHPSEKAHRKSWKRKMSNIKQSFKNLKDN